MKVKYFSMLHTIVAKYGAAGGWLDSKVHELAAFIGPDARADVALWNTSKGGFECVPAA